MCLIIHKPAGKLVPAHHLRTAIRNNPHGWGLYAANDGEFCLLRSAAKADVEQTIQYLNEEFAEEDVLFHLRYNTRGKTSLRNAHPFPILEYKTDGVDVRMVHNGTISAYGKGDESDTRAFVREFVRPLFKRIVKGLEDPTEILSDPFLVTVLQKGMGTANSVLVFMDNYGNTLKVNEAANKGVVWSGVYYSNTYSLDPEHREDKELPNFTATKPALITVGGTTTTTDKEKTGGATTEKKFTEGDWIWGDKGVDEMVFYDYEGYKFKDFFKLCNEKPAEAAKLLLKFHQAGESLLDQYFDLTPPEYITVGVRS